MNRHVAISLLAVVMALSLTGCQHCNLDIGSSASSTPKTSIMLNYKTEENHSTVKNCLGSTNLEFTWLGKLEGTAPGTGKTSFEVQQTYKNVHADTSDCSYHVSEFVGDLRPGTWSVTAAHARSVITCTVNVVAGTQANLTFDENHPNCKS